MFLKAVTLEYVIGTLSSYLAENCAVGPVTKTWYAFVALQSVTPEFGVTARTAWKLPPAP